jgi:hypothetical protein
MFYYVNLCLKVHKISVHYFHSYNFRERYTEIFFFQAFVQEIIFVFHLHVVRNMNTSYWNTLKELRDTRRLVFNLSLTHVTVSPKF